MRLTSSGRVGIGTATPVDTLDVNGDLLTTGAVTGQGRTLLQTTDGPARCSPASRGALLLSAGPGGVGVPGVCGADGRVHPLQAP